MRKFTAVVMIVLMSLFVIQAFAESEVQVIDKTGTDFQYYWYTGTFGKQITVDDNGKVHVVYTKTWCTESDTSYQITYKNITDNVTLAVPSQEPEKPAQPGIALIGGGQNGTPVYIFYGMGGRFYTYGADMHLMAMAKVSDDGQSIVPLGVQTDKNYYHNPYYANPFAMEVDRTNGIVHCLLTNPGGDAVGYFNFDGVAFGEIYQMYFVDAGNNVPGKSVPGKYRRNATKGADLAISPDGQNIAVAGLHPRCNVDVTIGSLMGEVWPDDFEAALGNGTFFFLYDTTNSADGLNIPNNDPKPYTDLQIVYDDEGTLHIVFDATYVDVYIDTMSHFPDGGWMQTYSSGCAGDTNAVFYDGSEHPKPQLLYWNSKTNTITTLAECEYPKSGESYKWYAYQTFDSGGAANWGKWINDGPISNFDLIANHDPQQGEPKLVLVWEEMQEPFPALADTDNVFGPNYYAWSTDLKISVFDGSSWSSPYNITNTPDMGEQEVSVYGDVVDNYIHMLYYRDSYPGRDRNLIYCDDYQDKFVAWAPKDVPGHFSVPIRVNQDEQVDVVYHKFDLSEITAIDDNQTVPGKFQLAQNYPNPFNPTTEIQYTVPTGKVTLEIFNVLGQKVKTLVNESKVAGTYKVTWDGTDFAGNRVASGVYFYKLRSGKQVQIRKMLLQK